MDHNLQVLLAIGISAALCLANADQGSPFQDQSFSPERQLTARTRGVKAAGGLRSSASSRSDGGMGLRRQSNRASTVEMMRLKTERRSHFGAPPPIAQAATVFEE